MDDFLTWLESPKTWISIGIVVLAILIGIIIEIAEHKIAKKNKHAHKSAHNGMRLFNNILKYALLLIALIAVLEINGINVTSLITGLGIVTAVVGFALQDFLKDVIMGINLVWDRYFKIGDVIKYEDDYWEVIDMNIKTTKLRNIDLNSVYTIANRNFTQIEVVGAYQDIVIPGDYSIPHDKMVSVCEEITKDVISNEMIEKCEFIGTDAFLDSQISYMIRVYSKPLVRDEVRRFTLGRIQDILAKNQISIPFNQLDVHVDKKN